MHVMQFFKLILQAKKANKLYIRSQKIIIPHFEIYLHCLNLSHISLFINHDLWVQEAQNIELRGQHILCVPPICLTSNIFNASIDRGFSADKRESEEKTFNGISSTIPSHSPAAQADSPVVMNEGSAPGSQEHRNPRFWSFSISASNSGGSP